MIHGINKQLKEIIYANPAIYWSAMSMSNYIQKYLVFVFVAVQIKHT